MKNPKPSALLLELVALFEASGWSVQTLLDKSKLKIDRSSLARKLTGELRMKIEEYEALLRPLKQSAASEARAS